MIGTVLYFAQASYCPYNAYFQGKLHLLKQYGIYYAKPLKIIIRIVSVDITKSYKDDFDVYARSLECFSFCYLISSLMILSFEIQCQKCILSCDV